MNTEPQYDETPRRRNVFCELCGREMYYYGDSRFEPEIWVNVAIGDVTKAHDESGFRAHVACWNKTIAKLAPHASYDKKNTGAAVIDFLKSHFRAA